MNKKVYILAFLLFCLSAGLVYLRLERGGQSIKPEFSRNIWRTHIFFDIEGQGARGKVRLTLPKDNSRQTIYNEHFENDEMVFYIREKDVTGNRLGYWSSEILSGGKRMRYTFSSQLKEQKYMVPHGVRVSDKPLEAFAPEFHKWLEPSEKIQSQDKATLNYLKKIRGKEKDAGLLTRRIFDFVRGEVKYVSEKGSKDAFQTLDKLVADCGGKARLFVALSRAAGIPSRIVGGIIISEGVKNITHVWAENYIGNEWIPFDTVNNYYAEIPSHYLEMYRGDTALIRHLGLKKIEYYFLINPEVIPPVDNIWSLYVIPTHFQSLTQLLLLIPIGALVVAFFRTVIGVPTYGTFSPILLAIAFREMNFEFGLLCLGIIIAIGWVVRKGLDHLKILVIPRLSILVTTVVMIVLSMMVVGFHLGYQKVLYISLFPMVIMTWTIERLSVLQIEDGAFDAFRSAVGTIAVAVAAYSIMRIHEVRLYLYTFPELLFCVMALLLLLGRYTGIRFFEIIRFAEFFKLHPFKKRS